MKYTFRIITGVNLIPRLSNVSRSADIVQKGNNSSENMRPLSRPDMGLKVSLKVVREE